MNAEEYWSAFLASQPANLTYPQKSYVAEGNPIPEVGLISIVLDGAGQPLCIIETVEVTQRRFDEVDADFARAEGEGDFSLDYWRDAHQTFFSRTLPKIGKQFSADMPLVCERFQLIYK